MNTKKNAQTKKYRDGLHNLCLEILGGKCVICGTTDNLHFHHIDPATKVASIAQLIRTHPALLADEIQKCILLCKKDHKQLHYGKKGE